MRSGNKGRNWRLGYGVFCLVYAGWVVYLGLDNFAKVYGEYQRARERRQPAQVEEIARETLLPAILKYAGPRTIIPLFH